MRVKFNDFRFSLFVTLWAGISPALAVDVTPKDITSYTSACTGKNITTSPRQVDGNVVFNAQGGGQQLDPQLAVGGGSVIGVTNAGITMYTKAGAFVGGGNTSCLNLDFDPKAFFDPFGKRFVLASISWAGNIRISFSKTSDPKGGWWAYTFPAPGWVDGGAVGGNNKWITYSYPASGGQKVFLFDREKAEAGATVSTIDLPVMSFPGQPVFTYDKEQANLYFVKLDGNSVQVNYVTPAGTFQTQPAVKTNLGLSYPTPFPQKGGRTCSAGDINPKLSIMRNGSIWTAHAATARDGGTTRSTARFYQTDLTGKVIQTGAIDDPTGAIYSGQVTLAVNKNSDLLLVFQQSGSDSYISSRMSYRLASDPLGTLRPAVKHAEGQGANTGTAAWGDYSGASVDGDNDLDMWGINSVASPSGSGNSVIFGLKLDASPVLHYNPAFPKYTVRQFGGSLFLSGLGLNQQSRIEIFSSTGSHLFAQSFVKNRNGIGNVTIATSRLPTGPVFMRLSQNGNYSNGQWMFIQP